MAKDYKHRTSRHEARNSRRGGGQSGPGVVKSMLITAIVISFVVFLVYLKSPGFNKQADATATNPSTGKIAMTLKSADAAKENKPQQPHFDFYTILPKKEVIVKDYEVKTRAREEQVGKNKPTNYILQAGSYKDYDEADQMKAKLALMGIESKIQKAKVESVSWYRVKIGPYSQLDSVNSTMYRLQKNGIKPVVTEVDGG